MVPSVTAYRLSLYGKTAFLWHDTDASLATAEPLLLCEQQVDDECQLALICWHRQQTKPFNTVMKCCVYCAQLALPTKPAVLQKAKKIFLNDHPIVL